MATAATASSTVSGGYHVPDAKQSSVTRYDITGTAKAPVGGTPLVDAKLHGEFDRFIQEHKTGKRRNHVELGGEYGYFMLRDTTRFVKETEDGTIDILLCGVLEPYQKRGVFASALQYLMKQAKAAKHWAYVYVECVHNPVLLKHLMTKYPGAHVRPYGDPTCVFLPI